MRFLSIAAALIATVSGADAFWKGFNLAANKADGSCKNQGDWQNDFNRLKSLPGYFTSVRLYASSDCGTLANAVPAALNTGTKILVGVWTQDEAHFAAEKAALASAIQNFGSDWILAISVGSEDLYRKEADPNVIANKIYDVRGMVRQWGVNQEVGHVDTWTAWVDPANEVVIRAADFIGHNGFPYWEGSTIEGAADAFWGAVQRTRDAVNRVSPGKWVWVTETGWPVSGDNFGAATVGIPNAQTYWKNVACSAFSQVHTFWYIDQEVSQKPEFGVLNSNYQPYFDLNC